MLWCGTCFWCGTSVKAWRDPKARDMGQTPGKGLQCRNEKRTLEKTDFNTVHPNFAGKKQNVMGRTLCSLLSMNRLMNSNPSTHFYLCAYCMSGHQAFSQREMPPNKLPYEPPIQVKASPPYQNRPSIKATNRYHNINHKAK